MKVTVEKVLNLSNNPNTEGGSKAVPIGPKIIINNEMPAIIPRLLSPAFLLDIARTIREERERITTRAVTIKCIIFWKYMLLSPLTHGKREYPTLQIHSIAINRAIPILNNLGFVCGMETHTATIDTKPQGPNRELS